MVNLTRIYTRTGDAGSTRLVVTSETRATDVAHCSASVNNNSCTINPWSWLTTETTKARDEGEETCIKCDCFRFAEETSLDNDAHRALAHI